MVFEHRRGRDRLFIVAEILEVVKDGALKTQIMYRANLSFTQLNDYLRFMLRINMLEKVSDRYEITGKGMDFLQRYREITELLKFDLEEEASIKTKVKRQTETVRDSLA